MDYNKSITHHDLVLIDRPCDGVATVILNRTEKRNALSLAVIAALNVALESLDQDITVRVIILTGPPGGPFSGRWRTHLGLVNGQTDEAAPVKRVPTLTSSGRFAHQKPTRSNILKICRTK